MNHVTSIGLDVHARSVTAVAPDSITGEVRSQKFGYSPAEIAGWILQLDSPKAVYESGVTGFHLVRELREMGVDCIVGAVSKMHKPASDRRKKNDRNDAEFLARQLMAHNIVEVFVPDVETEGARNLSRALEDVRDDLTRAKHRLTHLLIRWGYIWNEFNEDGKRRGSWTHAHWEWIRGIELPDAAARESLDYYISEVRHIESQKKAIEKRVAQCASRPRWRDRVEALRCMKGIETVTAFALTVEAGGVLPLRFGARLRELAWARSLRALERRARLPGRHHQSRQLSLAEAARGGILALHPRHERAEALALRRERSRFHIEPCGSRRQAPRGKAPPSILRAAQAACGRKRRYSARAGLLDMGARAHERRSARVEGAMAIP